ncbi:hypothetical protein AAH979_37830 [Plantactinospora sp. ZYX-F-223]|uniref:hypothetical protein n=1 Tax=Plantactinospora sp. ZYX-F-223 TaxID=3144103 RepID=UPI0031FDBBC7
MAVPPLGAGRVPGSEGTADGSDSLGAAAERLGGAVDGPGGSVGAGPEVAGGRGRITSRGRASGPSGAPSPTGDPDGGPGRRAGGPPGPAETPRDRSPPGPESSAAAVGLAAVGPGRGVAPPGPGGPGRIGATGPGAGTVGPPGAAATPGRSTGATPLRPDVPDVLSADGPRPRSTSDRCSGTPALPPAPDAPAPGSGRVDRGTERFEAGRSAVGTVAGAAGSGAGNTMGSPRPSRGAEAPVRRARDTGAAGASGVVPRPIGRTGAATTGGVAVAGPSAGGGRGGN